VSEQEFTKDLHVEKGHILSDDCRLVDEQGCVVGNAWEWGHSDRKPPVLPAMANAHLWAAAPEMYEALAKLVDEVAGPDAESELSTGERIALAGARVALRKARGGEG